MRERGEPIYNWKPLQSGSDRSNPRVFLLSLGRADGALHFNESPRDFRVLDFYLDFHSLPVVEIVGDGAAEAPLYQRARTPRSGLYLLRPIRIRSSFWRWAWFSRVSC